LKCHRDHVDGAVQQRGLELLLEVDLLRPEDDENRQQGSILNFRQILVNLISMSLELSLKDAGNITEATN